jgi:cell division initiation protein
MRLTPLDIRQQQFRRVMRGLDADEVEQFLATVANEFEALVAANNDMRQRVAELDEKIVEYRNMEKALRDALLAAEKVMGEAKEGAQREAALIVREAEMSADRSKTRLVHDLQRLQDEIAALRRLKDGYLSRVRWLLRSQLEQVEGHTQEFVELDASLGLGPAPRPAAPETGYGAAVDRVFADPGGPRSTPPESEWRPATPPQAEWNPDRPTPPATAWPGPEPAAPAGGLEDVLRPVGADGTYDRAGTTSRPLTAEEIAQAARRAERLAAEARAALERHGAGLPPTRDSERPGRDGPR